MCRGVLLSIIRLYWKCWPSKWRRRCLFRVTCSQYVFNITSEHGLIKGIKALNDRWGKCRGGYRIEMRNGEIFVRLRDGEIVNESVIADHILESYKKRRM